MRLRALLAVAVLAVPVYSWAAVPDDRFIAGYAAAVLEREFSLRSDGLVVADGHVRFPDANLSNSEREELIKSLGKIEGVKDVTLYEPPAIANKATTLDKIGETFEPQATTQPVSVVATTSASPDASETSILAVAPELDQPKTTWLSIGRTFDPLMADPRWPHFFAEYQHYDESGTIRLKDAVSVGFGETISLIRQEYPSGFRWEAGVQGGLFAIFDMDSNSADLIDADYFGGPYAAARFNKFSVLGRVFHESTHLGDEYLLRTNHVERLNYSYEEADILLSYDLPAGLRIYGGTGVAFDQDPGSELHPWSFQEGVEWRDPDTIPGASFIRPVAAVDMQERQTNDYRFSYSLRAGVQFEDPTRFSQRLQLLLEYYDGDSENGQFFKDRNKFYGFGVHFFF